MIIPTALDLGRKVVYRSHRNAEPEEGEISSLAKQGGQIDPRFVFVRFRGPNGELTPTSKLEWMAP
jgi:hypothetical protein